MPVRWVWESEYVLHGESSTDQASPRTPTQRTCQPQEAVQPQRNQTILQADTPAQKANYSYKRSHPTPLEADAHTSHVHKNASACTQSPGGRPPSTCTHRTSQPAEVADATTIRTPPRLQAVVDALLCRLKFCGVHDTVASVDVYLDDGFLAVLRRILAVPSMRSVDAYWLAV